MRISFSLLFILLVFRLLASNTSSDDHPPEALISPLEAKILLGVPERTLPEHLRHRSLPSSIDNSQLLYFPPIMNQESSASCGQAAGVAYAFTYEMARSRDLDASLPENRYPTHFAYNFMNYNGYYGVNYMHSYEILKAAGSPTIAEYGGMYIDNGRIWPTGYEKYRSAMRNRVKMVHKINVGTPEGLNSLKHWLVHRHEDASTGGVATFNAASPWNLHTLPAGTPEAGKRVIPWFGGNDATHAMTIVGYNDSIRFDINGDGQFTNHLDINGDGVVDMRDWEIGAMKFANSYGDNWADEGYAYLMYSALAKNVYNGGIWNNVVHVVDVHDAYEPQLTIRLTIEHNTRELIRLVAGVASDTTSNIPEHKLYFPVFNYQGGPNFMQGHNYHDSLKRIEIGLDISPLLNYIEPGKAASFFLEVHENDPFGRGSGQVISYALRDYNGEIPLQIDHPETHIPLINNDITRLRIVHVPDFDKVTIISDEIPVQEQGFQLEASGGAAPYRWELAYPYHQQTITDPFPQVEENQLQTVAPNHVFALQELPFSFPFFGGLYDTVYVHRDGFLLFEPGLYPWPYYQDINLLLRNMKAIAALMTKPVMYYDTKRDDWGMWYEGNSEMAAFRWRKPLVVGTGQVVYGEASFALKLFPDGKIEFFYNDIKVEESVLWNAGVSAGDNASYALLHGSNSTTLPSNTAARLVPVLVPEGVSLSESGYLTLADEPSSAIEQLAVKVSDDKFSSDTRHFQWSTVLGFEYDFVPHNGNVVHNGSDGLVSLKVRNLTQQTILNLNAELIFEDSFVEVHDRFQSLGDLPPNGVAEVLAFPYTVSSDCPDKHTFIADVLFSDGHSGFNGKLYKTIMASRTVFYHWMIDDGDNFHLDAGETTSMVIKLKNNGSFIDEDVKAMLLADDPYISVHATDEMPVGDILPGETKGIAFEMTVSPDCPIGHEANFQLAVRSTTGQVQHFDFNVSVGQYAFLLFNKARNELSANAFQSILDSLNLSYAMVESLPQELDIYRALIVCLGGYSSNRPLSQDEGTRLGEYLIRGGNLYMEGSRTWYPEPATNVHSMFHIGRQLMNPPVMVDSLIGIEGSFGHGFRFAFGGSEGMSFYNLVALPGAQFVLRSSAGETAYTVVAFQGANYRTVGSQFEFWNFGAEEDFEQRKAFFIKMLGYFGMEHLLYIGLPEYDVLNGTLAQISAAPNPFRQDIVLTVKWPEDEWVSMQLFDHNGRILHKAEPVFLHKAEPFQWEWAGMGKAMANGHSGLYLVRFFSAKRSQTIKILKTD